MKVWCEVAFQNVHTWILKQIAARQYDFYFLCDIDLPWEQDGLREYPDINIRRKIFKMYYDIVVNAGSRWAVVSGSHSERLQAAISLLDTIYPKR